MTNEEELEEEVHRFYSMDHWVSVYFDVPCDQCSYSSPLYDKIAEWCGRLDTTVDIQCIVHRHRSHAKGERCGMAARFFFDQNERRARHDAILFKLWLKI